MDMWVNSGEFLFKQEGGDFSLLISIVWQKRNYLVVKNVRSQFATKMYGNESKSSTN